MARCPERSVAGSSGKAVAASKGLSVLETKSILKRRIFFVGRSALRWNLLQLAERRRYSLRLCESQQYRLKLRETEFRRISISRCQSR